MSLDTWHTVVLSYTGAIETGSLYLDSEWVCDTVFTCNHQDDHDISTHNGASGKQFKGIFRELKVYTGPVDPTGSDTATWGAVKAMFR